MKRAPRLSHRIRKAVIRRLCSLTVLGLTGATLGCATNFTDGPSYARTAWQEYRAHQVTQPAELSATPPRVTHSAQPASLQTATGAVVPVAFHQPDVNRSGAAVHPAAYSATHTAHFTPAEPRLPLANANQDLATDVMDSAGLVYQYPDEYIFDGGDRGMKVHYSRGERLGVETEDTFAEYSDHSGQQHVRASNAVAIYAPRFAAVRTMSGPEQDVSVDRLAMARDAIPGAGFVGRVALATSNRRSKASGFRTRERGSELDTIDASVAMQTQARAAGNYFVLKPLKRRQIQSGAQFDHANEAWLANRIQKAADWSMKAYPVVQGVTAAANEVEGTFRPQVHIGIDTEAATGSLHVIKMADVDRAVPGDIITFTIRFENTGNKALHDVRIIDNLTPRLEYIADSAGSDLPGRIVVDENGLGSKILRFELEGEIAGGASGTVEFQARVR